MVDWFSEVIVERILQPIFELLLNTITGIAETVFSIIFGAGFTEIIEQFSNDVFMALASILSGYVITAINNWFHGTLLSVLFVLDIIAMGFGLVSSTSPLQVRTAAGGWEQRYLTEFVMGSGGVRAAFFGVMLIGMILCIGFTMFAVAKSMFDIEDNDNKRSVGTVLRKSGQSMLIYLLLPFLMIAGINMCSLLYRKASEIVHNSGDNITMGSYIYAAVMQDATRDKVPSYTELRTEQTMNVLTKGTLGRIENLIQMLAAGAGELDRLTGHLVEGTTPEYMYFPELQRLIRDSKNTGIPLRNLVIDDYLSGQHGGAFVKALGFNGMPYLDLYYTGQLLRYERVHSVVGLTVVLPMLIFMFISSWNVAKDLFQLVLLYIISPYFVAFIPLDDGELFKKWKDLFILRLTAGYGVVLAMNIFLLMIPIIFSRTVMFSVFLPLDFFIRIVLMLAAAGSVVKSHKLITETLEKGSSIRDTGSSNEAESITMALPKLAYGMAKSKGAEKMKKTSESLVSTATSATTQSVNWAAQRFTGAKRNKQPAKNPPPKNDHKDQRAKDEKDEKDRNDNKNQNDSKNQ